MRYVTERADGIWRVRDTVDGQVVDYGAGSRGAAAAAAGASRLNRTNDSRPGNEVRAWRTAHGLTQAGLAKLLGVQWLAVQRWEAGTRTPPPFLRLALKQLEQDLSEPATLTA